MKNHLPIVIELGEPEQQVFDSIIRELISNLTDDFQNLAGLIESVFQHEVLEATIGNGEVNPRLPVAPQTVEFLEVVNGVIVSFLRLYGIHYIGPLKGKVNSISGR